MDRDIYIRPNQEAEGPYSLHQLKEMLRRGEITEDTAWSVEQATDWKPLKSLMFALDDSPPTEKTKKSMRKLFSVMASVALIAK